MSFLYKSKVKTHYKRLKVLRKVKGTKQLPKQPQKIETTTLGSKRWFGASKNKVVVQENNFTP